MIRSQLSWKAGVAIMQAAKLDRLQRAEFALKMSHPEVFVSYRAAHSWALAELNRTPSRYMGDPLYGWCVDVCAHKEGYACSVSQVWWNADHCGAVRPTGALAIVQAVLEMQAGY